MKIVLTKSILLDFLKKAISENRTGHTADISMIPAKDDESAEEFAPIIPDEQMSVQLSTSAPPVGDESYVPNSIPELGDAAKVIASEVPDEARYIEKFYQMLHKVLDGIQGEEAAAARDFAYGEEDIMGNPDEENQEQEDIMESLRFFIRESLNESLETSPEVSTLSETASAFYTSAFNELLNAREHFLPPGVVASVGRIDPTPENRSEMKMKMFDYLGNHVNFRDVNYDDPELRKARKLAVEDALNHYFYRAEAPTEDEMSQLAIAADQGKLDRAEVKAKQEAVREAFSLWDINQGDLDAIKIALETLVDDQGGSPKGVYLQAALDAVIHISDDYADSLNKTKFEQVLKAVLGSEDLNPMHADDVFDVSWMQTVDTPEEEDLATMLQSFDRHLDKQAAFFGFSGASGMRQWMSKFPERMFKVLGGGATELIEEFTSFTNDIFSAMEDFCLNATDQIEKMAAKEKDPAKKTKLESLTKGFQLMRSQILEDEAEELDLRTLETTGAGWVVRFAFGRTITQPIFKKLHTDWDKAMQETVSSMGIQDPKRIIVKTLIGETDPPDLSDTQALSKLGVSPDVYQQLLKMSNDWFSNYFSENRKDLRKIMGQRSQDIAKIKNALKKAISEDVPDELASQAAQTNFSNAAVQAAQQSSQDISENSFEKSLHEVVNKMIGSMS